MHGKGPGFTPLSLLELLKRRGKYHPEDFARLQLAAPFDLVQVKETWLGALGEAETFGRQRPPEELGCLYYSRRDDRFVVPRPDIALADQSVSLHFGTPGACCHG